MDIRKLIEKYSDYTIEMRRWFHENPELSMEEVETTKKIAEELDKMGIEYFIPKTAEGLEVGVIGTIYGGKPGKTIALRSDIDALNVTEVSDREYVSKNVGKMHACGHDAHGAILLGAAKILNEIKDELPGKIYLLFQPAEEIGQGAKFLMEQGTWYEETDAFFGTHVWVDLPAGQVSVEAGERMAAADKFEIKVHGLSGHGSLPNQTIDTVVVGSAIVMALQSLVSRTYSPLDSVTVTVGQIHSGTRWNIIAGEAYLDGTVRYFNPEVGARVEDDIRRVVENTAAAYGATVDIQYDRIVLPTFNEAKHAAIAEKSAAKIVGEENVVSMTKTPGGEDFSFYLQDGKPGVFGFVGVRNDEIGACYPHHNERFDIDESALALGAGIYAQYTIDYLMGE